MATFEPSTAFRSVVALDLLAFAAYYLLPQLQAVESPALRSALELEGYGALIASSHPVVVNAALILRFVFAGLLFFGIAWGRYALVLAMLLSCVATAVGGLAVFTSLDLLALTVMYFLDGYLLARSANELRVRGLEVKS